MTQHYVFVQGIGGFMLQQKSGRIITVPASKNEAGGIRLLPPSYEISFNRFLTHDDGLLADAYMEVNNISYEEAVARIRQEISGIRRQLEESGKYELGNLGQLYYDEDCHISFQPAENRTSQPQTFGLEPIEIHRQEIIPANHDRHIVQENEKYVISIRKRWLQHAAVIILILGCFFADFSPFRTRDNHVNNYASIIGREILSGNQRPNIFVDHSWEEILEEESSMTTGTASQSLSGAIDTALLLTRQADPASISPETASAAFPAPEKEIAPSANGKVYYIIISSCLTQEEAEQDVRRFSRLGYENIDILDKDGRFRLYINVFAQKTSAEDYLNELRQVATFHDAWLLPVRQNSISHISKNTHNEQLSMELSHLITGTERDQG